MTDINMRASVLAIKPEVTEGTPLKPTATDEYIAIQDDLALSPAFDPLENAEMKASIGKSKTILGAENPTATLSHYLRASGTEGVAPSYGELLKSLFGSEHVRSTERDTVAGSTVSSLNVDSGEGVEFARGHMLLVKDSTNGYAIRPVHSVSTDALGLGFDLSNAPASGVNLGKGVSYLPTQTGHQALSIWNYMGNAGAVKMISGAKVTEFGYDIEAGDLINANFSLEALKFYFNPVLIDSSNKYVDFNDGGVQVASVAEEMYSDPHELAAALQTAMDGQSTDTITVSYSDSTGKYTIATDGATLSLLWSTGANTANTMGSELGFVITADDTLATTYTSDSAIDLTAPQTPAYDDADPLPAKGHTIFVGDSTDNVCFQPSNISVKFGNERTVKPDICADSGRGGSSFVGREVTVSVKAYIDQYDVDMFKRYRSGQDTRFMHAFGEKTGGNWIAGKCGAAYLPTATIVTWDVIDKDGIASIEIELKAYVDDSGNGEFYLGLV